MARTGMFRTASSKTNATTHAEKGGDAPAIVEWFQAPGPVMKRLGNRDQETGLCEDPAASMSACKAGLFTAGVAIGAAIKLAPVVYSRMTRS